MASDRTTFLMSDVFDAVQGTFGLVIFRSTVSMVPAAGCAETARLLEEATRLAPGGPIAEQR
jgi:hypothetical protein